MSNSRDLLKTLVAFDTTSRESNLQLIEFVRDYLERFDVPCELLYNDERSKANLFATIGPADRPGIVLSGHTDVVPVDGQPWTCLLYTSPSPRDQRGSRMPSSA